MPNNYPDTTPPTPLGTTRSDNLPITTGAYRCDGSYRAGPVVTETVYDTDGSNPVVSKKMVVTVDQWQSLVAERNRYIARCKHLEGVIDRIRQEVK